METLRTPEDRFADLPDFPWQPAYTDIDDGDGGTLRVAHVEAGPADGSVVLCLHGEPSWSFLYRRMLPVFETAGLRAVAPDLVGFGRSDKPAARSDYTYQRHVDWIRNWIEAMGLDGVTLVCQDWGGLIGLRVAAENPERFTRIVAANTFLPTGDVDPGPAFASWQKLSQEIPELPVGQIVNAATTTDLTPDVIAAYDAPFPDESYKAGARRFPMLVPTRPDDPASVPNRAAWGVLSRWEKPFLTAFSDSDPITRGADVALQAAIPGTKGQPHTTIEDAGHFLQEDKGPELARVVVDFVRGT
ncbi:MAG: haloalkane dehalogenase [Acidimicrobiia bacterium]|nr:haloalkane dehalogenase [Acidimicrobiia bacterium]